MLKSYFDSLGNYVVYDQNTNQAFYPMDGREYLTWRVYTPIQSTNVVFEIDLVFPEFDAQNRTILAFKNIYTAGPPTWDPVYAAYSGTPVTQPPNPGQMPPAAVGSLGSASGVPGSRSVGEPISVGTGNVYYETTDYQTYGQHPLQLKRSYNSLGTGFPYRSSFGIHWTSNFDSSLSTQTDASKSQFPLVVAQRPDGQVLYFQKASGAWKTDSDIPVSYSSSSSGYALTFMDGTVEQYSPISASQALLASIKFPGGYVQTIARNADHSLNSVTDSFGRKLKFTTSAGLVTGITTPDGQTINYTYDASGITGKLSDRLTSVTYSMTGTASESEWYLYEISNNPSALTGINDGKGVKYQGWTYDNFSRGLTNTIGSNTTTSVSYNDSDGSRVVTTPLGEQDTYKFSFIAGSPKVVEIDRLATSAYPAAKKLFTYDSNGYLSSETDWNGNLTTYSNDIVGRVMVMVEAAGTAAARTTAFSYLTTTSHKTKITHKTYERRQVYDANFNLVSRTDTDTTSQTIPYSTRGTQRTWNYQWTKGLLTQVQSPRTDLICTTSFAYGDFGVINSITDALGHVTTLQASSPGGYPLQFLEPNGLTTQIHYGNRLRPTTITRGSRITSFTYDAAGLLLSSTLPDGQILKYGYDRGHRPISCLNSAGETTLYGLDASGQPHTVALVDPTSAIQRGLEWDRDATGNLVGYIGGAGQSTSYGYDLNGNKTSRMDPNGHSITVQFDSLNRITQTKDALGGTTVVAVTPQDLVGSITDGNGSKTLNTYDGFGRLIQQTSPDSGTTVLRYDLNGNISQRISASGSVANYSYDALDRRIGCSYPANSSGNVSFVYDQANHGHGVGHLTEIDDPTGTTSRNFDAYGNMTSETRTDGTTKRTIQFAYDSGDRVQTVNYPYGAVLTYVRDSIGRIASAKITYKNRDFPIVSSLTYLPFGPIQGMTYGNGMTDSRVFDGDYRVTSILTKGTANQDKLSLAYDNASNLLGSTLESTTSSTINNSYQYDALDHIIGYSGILGNNSYSYDPVGNRLSQTLSGVTTKFGYLSHSNRLTGFGKTATSSLVTYTPEGNISSVGGGSSGATYAFDTENRLISSSVGASLSTQYGVDAIGVRRSKQTSQGTVRMTYDSYGRVLESTGPSSSAINDYIYLDDGQIVAMFVPSSNAVYFVHSNPDGSPRKLTDAKQATQWSCNYDPFGLTSSSGSVDPGNRFPGQWYDSETGLSHNGFRNYAPAIGRYIETDPIGLGGGLNTYAYAGGNPLRFADEFGLDLSFDHARSFDVTTSSKELADDVSRLTRLADRNQKVEIAFGYVAVGGLRFNKAMEDSTKFAVNIFDKDDVAKFLTELAAKLGFEIFVGKDNFDPDTIVLPMPVSTTTRTICKGN